MSLEIEIDVLKTLIDYNPKSGVLVWKVNLGNKAKAGDIATVKRADGYLRVSVFSTSYFAHRIAWAIHYGHWPRFVIDHINRDKSDNRISNLRDVTSATNSKNYVRNEKRYLPIETKGDWLMKNGVMEAVLSAGSQQRLADQLGVTQQAVSTWLRRGWVPLRRAQEIEAITGVARANLINPRVMDLVDLPEVSVQ